jgi:hypothetical protein
MTGTKFGQGTSGMTKKIFGASVAREILFAKQAKCMLIH